MQLSSVWEDHAPERKESFYAKIDVSAFVNFEVDRLKKMMKKFSKTEVWQFPYVVVYVYFTYFEGFI